MNTIITRTCQFNETIGFNAAFRAQPEFVTITSA